MATQGYDQRDTLRDGSANTSQRQEKSVQRDAERGVEQEPQGIGRRTVIKTGLGFAVALTAGGIEAWRQAPTAQAAAHFGRVPSIIDCDTWGAKPPSEPVTVLNIRSKKIIVHHTEYPNSTDYSLAHAYWLARDIQHLHMDINGWIDTGQHFTVSRGGYILEGRHRSLEALQNGYEHIRGAHCPGLNSEAIGIENEGTYFTVLPPRALWDSLVDLCVYVCRQYGINANNVFGHWDFTDTDCPGAAFYQQFPELRRQIAARVGRVFDIPARTWPDHRYSTSGEVVKAIQYLLRARGYTITAIDGQFGDEVDSAVRQFQADHGIPVDGYTTNETWEALVMPFKKQDMQGDPVSAIQDLLNHKVYTVTVSGTYDHDTMKALQSVQRLHGLPPSGLVDLRTWCVVVGGIVREEFFPLL